MQKKGQITIELTIIIFIAIALIFNTLVLPLSHFSLRETESVGNSALAAKAVDSIANTVKMVGISGDGAKDHIDIDTRTFFKNLFCDPDDKSINITYVAFGSDITDIPDKLGMNLNYHGHNYNYSASVDFDLDPNSIDLTNFDDTSMELCFENDAGTVKITDCSPAAPPPVPVPISPTGINSCLELQMIGHDSLLSIYSCPECDLSSYPVDGSYFLNPIGTYNNGHDYVDCSMTNPANQLTGYVGPWDDGHGFDPIGTFTGTLDGKNYDIYNLKGRGLFSEVKGNALLQNFGLKNAVISGEDIVGGIINTVSTGNVMLKNVYFDGTVTATSFIVGGIIGSVTAGDVTLDSVFTSGLITSAGFHVGGLIGESTANAITVSNSYSTATIESTNPSEYRLGGFFGNLGASSLQVENSYFAGELVVTNPPDIGALYFSSSNGVFNSVFWDEDVAGIAQNDCCYTSQDVNGVSSESTSDMVKESTYTGWDFTNTWKLASLSGDHYPCLAWQPDNTCPVATVPLGACGGETEITDSRDGKVYPIVEIGSQCWMAKNLNVGAQLCTGGTYGSECTVDMQEKDTDGDGKDDIEKYCYDNNMNNCNRYGGLYQWDEAMGYYTGDFASTNGDPVDTNGNSINVQGICPDGWHMPSDSEWHVLESYFATGTCEADRVGGTGSGCIPAGAELQNSKFNDNVNNLLAGTRWYIDGSFNYLDNWVGFWMSSYLNSHPIDRLLQISDSSVKREDNSGELFGLSVRCIKGDGIQTSILCGNGALDSGEECDCLDPSDAANCILGSCSACDMDSSDGTECVCETIPCNYAGSNPPSLTISSCEELQMIGYHPDYPLDGHYTLASDLSCNIQDSSSLWSRGYSAYYPGGYNGKDDFYDQLELVHLGAAGFRPIGSLTCPFTGSFNGAGHKISNLYINRPDENYVGLFGFVSAAATIEDVHLIDPQITGDGIVGALAGKNNGDISDSSIYHSSANYCNDLTVGGTSTAGGLIGMNGGHIVRSDVTVGVAAETCGGIVGSNSGEVANSHFEGAVRTSQYGGGIAGVNSGTITQSYNEGYLGCGSLGVSMGGIAGDNSGTISKCFNDGSVRGADEIGGLVGYNQHEGALSDSYNIGNVDGTNSAGVVGVNSGSIDKTYTIQAGASYIFAAIVETGSNPITESYYNNQLTGSACGSNPCTGVSGKSTSDMKKESTYNSWDFNSGGIWTTQTNSYPCHQWYLNEGGSCPT